MSQSGSSIVNICYPIETALKFFFIVLCPFPVPYVLILAFLASLFAIFRVCKTPQFNKEYLAKILMNNHGQNLLYITFGAIGFTNYLYYSPMVLFFGFNIIEFIKLKMPQLAINKYGDLIRFNKWWVYEGKSRLEIFFFLYLIFSLPFDFMSRGIKCFMMGQFLMVKYRINQEMRYSCTLINSWIEEKTSKIGPVNALYKKIAGWIHSYANRDISPQQQSQQQPEQPAQN